MIQLLGYPFIVNALLTGVFVAAIAGPCGYILISRNLTFAAHALPSVGFAGAAGAVLVGVAPAYGLLALTIAAGVGVGLVGSDLRERDVTIGILMALALGFGLLFLSLQSGFAQRVYGILFGSILGISGDDVRATGAGAAAVGVLFLVLYRPLVFSTFDPASAEAHGVPVRLVSVVFMVMVAVTVAVSIHVMGALLVFTLLIGPAATLARCARRPSAVMLGSAALGASYMVLGIALAALNGQIPVSFFVASISFVVYLPVRLATRAPEA
jgi:zinc/manganese transport system permease protein